MPRRYSTKVHSAHNSTLVKLIIALCIIITIANFILIVNVFFQNTSKVQWKNVKTWKGNQYLINATSCNIPNLNPYHQDISLWTNKPPTPLKCSNIPALVQSNDTSLFVVQEAKQFYDPLEYDDLNCCYYNFWRTNHEKLGTAYSKSCISFNSSVNVHGAEYVTVKCFIDKKVAYTDYFSFVPLKAVDKKTNSKQQHPDKLNVFVMGINAMSKFNMIRTMPKTLGYLKSIGTFNFRGHTLVRDNTVENIIPMLTGKFVEELMYCWDQTYVDECPYVWQAYKNSGFITSYAEDGDSFSPFYHNKNGFNKQPTDYFWTYFKQLAMRNIGNNLNGNQKLCLGSRLVFDVFMEYVSKFVKSHRSSSQPYFAFFWSNSMSHGELNRPKFADESFLRLFRRMHDEGDLNNTVLVFLSDQGYQGPEINHVFQGKLERRLPILFIRLPEWYMKKYPKLAENMKANTEKFTNHFDVYETFKDFLHPHNINIDNENVLNYNPDNGEELNNGTDLFRVTREYKEANEYEENEMIREKRYSPWLIERGYSLFKELPPTRKCKHSQIGPEMCSCQNRIELSKNHVIVYKAVEFIMNYLNGRLEKYQMCRKLYKPEVIRAKLRQHTFLGSLDLEFYTIRFMVEPTDSLFQATILRNSTTDTFELGGTISVVFADQRFVPCIYDEELVPFCHCNAPA